MPKLSTAVCISSWSSDLTGSDNPASIAMDGDKEITATFVEVAPQVCDFRSFVISQMSINWAKDDNSGGWGIFGKWFKKWFKPKNDDKFTISGRLQLPEGYTIEDLQSPPSAIWFYLLFVVIHI
ncbi:hypothetical protein ACFLW0_04300 [Chloroflexota bacterium]